VKYVVPVQAVIEVASPAEAQAASKKIEEMLKQGVVRFALQGKGVQLVDVRMEAVRPSPW
jgi:hypothetical protein